MEREFRFPLRSEERVTLVATGIVVLFIPFLLLAQIQMLSEGAGQSLGSVLRGSYLLRGILVLLGLTLVASAVGTWAWVRHRTRVRLIVGSTSLRWEAPPPLFLRGKEPSRTVSFDRVTGLRVGRMGSTFTRQVVLRIESIGDELTLPLDRALEDGKSCADYRADDARTWSRHTLVRAVEKATGQTCVRD
jgi:hypothetical protein